MPFSLIQVSPRRWKVVDINGREYSKKGLPKEKAEAQIRALHVHVGPPPALPRPEPRKKGKALTHANFDYEYYEARNDLLARIPHWLSLCDKQPFVEKELRILQTFLTKHEHIGAKEIEFVDRKLQSIFHNLPTPDVHRLAFSPQQVRGKGKTELEKLLIQKREVEKRIREVEAHTWTPELQRLHEAMTQDLRRLQQLIRREMNVGDIARTK